MESGTAKKRQEGDHFMHYQGNFKKNCSSANHDAKKYVHTAHHARNTEVNITFFSALKLKEIRFLENFVDEKYFLWYYLYR